MYTICISLWVKFYRFVSLNKFYISEDKLEIMNYESWYVTYVEIMYEKWSILIFYVKFIYVMERGFALAFARFAVRMFNCLMILHRYLLK